MTFDNAEAARLEYSKVRNKVKSMMRQARRKFEKDIAKNSKSNLFGLMFGEG